MVRWIPVCPAQTREPGSGAVRWCRNQRPARPKIHSISAVFRWARRAHHVRSGPGIPLHGFPDDAGLLCPLPCLARAGFLKKYLTNCEPLAACVSNKFTCMINGGRETSVTGCKVQGVPAMQLCRWGRGAPFRRRIGPSRHAVPPSVVHGPEAGAGVVPCVGRGHGIGEAQPFSPAGPRGPACRRHHGPSGAYSRPALPWMTRHVRWFFQLVHGAPCQGLQIGHSRIPAGAHPRADTATAKTRAEYPHVAQENRTHRRRPDRRHAGPPRGPQGTGRYRHFRHRRRRAPGQGAGHRRSLSGGRL